MIYHSPNAVAEVEPEPAISGAAREGNGKCGAKNADSERAPSIRAVPEGDPIIERCEQATLLHRYKMPLGRAKTLMRCFKKGTMWEDGFGNRSMIIGRKTTRNQFSMTVEITCKLQ